MILDISFSDGGMIQLKVSHDLEKIIEALNSKRPFVFIETEMDTVAISKDKIKMIFIKEC